MLAKFFQSKFAVQVVVIAAVAFTIHVIWSGMGLNIVLYNYYLGGHAFLSGQNPFEVTLLNGPSNQFKYSPLFALLSGKMAGVGIQNNTPVLWVVSLWVLANTAIFSLGLSKWCDLSRKASFCVLIAFIAALIDLLVSTSAYQVNAMCIGMILLGLAEYRDGRHASSGAILLLAVNVKVYAVVFLIVLALRFNWRYWLGAFCAGGAAFLLPVLFVGWSHNFEVHLAWVSVVLHDSGTYKILDVFSAFERVGLGAVGAVLYWMISIVSIVAFFVYGIMAREIKWQPWITAGVAALLLLSPKTEVYTYVFIAPAYIMMVFYCEQSGPSCFRKYGGFLTALFAAVIASARFVDPVWYKSENPNEIIRVIGALGIWAIAAVLLLKALYAASKTGELRLPRKNKADGHDEHLPNALGSKLKDN